MGKTCSKLTIKTPGRNQWRRSGVLSLNFEQCFSISAFEQVNVCRNCHLSVRKWLFKNDAVTLNDDFELEFIQQIHASNQKQII